MVPWSSTLPIAIGMAVVILTGVALINTCNSYALPTERIRLQKQVSPGVEEVKELRSRVENDKAELYLKNIDDVTINSQENLGKEYFNGIIQRTQIGAIGHMYERGPSRLRRNSHSGQGESKTAEGEEEEEEEDALPHRHNHERPRNKKRKKDRRRNRDKERRRDRDRERHRDKNDQESGVHVTPEESTTHVPRRTNAGDDRVTEPRGRSPNRETANLDDDYYAYDYFEEENRFPPRKNRRRHRKRQELISDNDSAPRDYAKLFQGSDFENAGSPDLSRQNPNIEVAIEILHGNYTSSEYTEVDDAGPNDFPVGQNIDFDEFAKAFQNLDGDGHPGAEEHALSKEDADTTAGGNDGDSGGEDDDVTVGGDDNKDNDDEGDQSREDKTEDSVDAENPTVDFHSYDLDPSDSIAHPDTSKEATWDNSDGVNDRATWSQWSACSVTCGGGTKQRHRTCGTFCNSTETQDCNNRRCSDPSEPHNENEESDEESEKFTHSELVMEELGHDSCEAWMNCRSRSLTAYLAMLQDLPSCPCFYPTNIPHNDSIWDQQKQKWFRWMDASSQRDRLDIYKPTARYCIRSRLSMRSTSLAAQQCCYNDEMRLITRGPGAGTPNLISAEVSHALHKKIDIMPWINCKGDWTRYNQIRPPNNLRGCTEVPDTTDFLQFYREAKNY